MDWPLIKLGPLERKAAANRLEHGTADRLNERFFFPPPRDVRIPNLSLLRESAQAFPGCHPVNSHAEDGYEYGILLD